MYGERWRRLLFSRIPWLKSMTRADRQQQQWKGVSHLQNVRSVVRDFGLILLCCILFQVQI